MSKLEMAAMMLSERTSADTVGTRKCKETKSGMSNFGNLEQGEGDEFGEIQFKIGGSFFDEIDMIMDFMETNDTYLTK